MKCRSSQDSRGAGTDLEGLYAYDSDRDGYLTEGDVGFSAFQLWIDSNANGRSEGKELFSLTELAIQSLSLEAFERAPYESVVRENQVVGKAHFERTDGSFGVLADVVFFVEAGSEPANLSY